MDADEANMANKAPNGKRRKIDNSDQENTSWNNILAHLESPEQEVAEEAAEEDVPAIQAVIGCNELQKDNNKEPEPNDPVELPLGSTTPIPMPNEVDDFLSGNQEQFMSPDSMTPNPTGTPTPNDEDNFLSTVAGNSNSVSFHGETPNNGAAAFGNVFGLGLRQEISAVPPQASRIRRFFSDSDSEDSEMDGRRVPVRVPAPTAFRIPLNNDEGHGYYLPGLREAQLRMSFRRFFSNSDSDDSEIDRRIRVRVPAPTAFRIPRNNDFIIHHANNNEHNDEDARMSHNPTRHFSDDVSSSSRSSSFMNLSISSDSFNSIQFQFQFRNSRSHLAQNDNDPGVVTANLVNAVMEKPKPSYTFNLTAELMQRENNNINRVGARGGHISLNSFSHGFHGSRQVVEQMTLLGRMNHHRRCLHCICMNFNQAGDLICSGSDDRYIAIWDWAKRKQLHKFKTGHALNISQTKFIDSTGYLDIVSTSRDGQVMRSIVPPSGGSSIMSTRLNWHAGSVPKIVVVPQTRHEMMSAGEDAAIMHYDLRSGHPATTLLHCTKSHGLDSLIVGLYSIAHHPYAPEFCVAGSDDKVRVYDKRKVTKPLCVISPDPHELECLSQITCAVYNYSGSEILASYKYSGIFLFDSRNCNGGTLHTYRGHMNTTLKGVNFFGPHSEYIVTGSDCGNIIFYDKNTEAIINFVKDGNNVVKCLEPHPWLPILATSGLDHDVKLWAPHGSKTGPCNSDVLRKTVTRNFRYQTVDNEHDDTSGSESDDDGLMNDSASTSSISSSSSSSSSSSNGSSNSGYINIRHS